MLKIKDLTKKYSTLDGEIVALNDVSFVAPDGEFIAIVGKSGSGKSTLLNMIGGLDIPDSGSILLDGTDIVKLSNRQTAILRRQKIGIIYQFYNLIPNLTALENVEIAAQLCEDPIPADKALAMVGLEKRKNNFPAQLSGGEQQRVAIARALAKNPQLLLCDEPTGALDYATGKAILKMLYDLSRERKTTVVIITHNQAIAPMADRIIRIKSGQILSNELNPNILPVEEIEW